MPAMPLSFVKESITARLILPSGEDVEKIIEIRTHPITWRTCRVALSRTGQSEPGTDVFPEPPPDAKNMANCPFCRPGVESQTPRLFPGLSPDGRLIQGDSILFPNLFPYGSYSAVSLFDNAHFVELGAALTPSYADCFINCRNYLGQVLSHDPRAVYLAITQNHLPSAGGSLIHPHLQINADRIPANHHRHLMERSDAYFQQTGRGLFSDYLIHEKNDGSRYIGRTGNWEWMAAFAPEGFYEIWGILPGVTSLRTPDDRIWKDLSCGVIHAQKFYRSLCRNGYNLGILSIEAPSSRAELRVVLIVRSNYAPWVRNDHTGFELMLGDMATFTLPEDTAALARPFWE
jgi:UDPglucose--hexose-1-phosphate uridylyltransferase